MLILNREMFKYSDVLLAVWDGKSNGTKHIIESFKNSKKPHYVKLV